MKKHSKTVIFQSNKTFIQHFFAAAKIRSSLNKLSCLCKYTLDKQKLFFLHVFHFSNTCVQIIIKHFPFVMMRMDLTRLQGTEEHKANCQI